MRINKSVVLFGVALGGLLTFNFPFLTSKALDRGEGYQAPAVQAVVEYPACDDHQFHLWHPAAKKDEQGNIICTYGHEHGDPPPQWIADAGYHLAFDHQGGFMANTSAQENYAKHAGMKGFKAIIKDVDVYARIHLASSVLDRASRYHSYELFLKDPSGGVSHFQGWLDTGDPTKDRIPYRDSTKGERGKDPGTRPIVWTTTRQACQIDQTWCIELWAMRSWDWGPDIIWGINDSTTFYNEGEENTADITKWDKSGSLGTDRSLTVTIYRNSEDLKKRGVNTIPVGKIWATQFGEIVSGPADPKCDTQTVKFGISYQNICLENFISPTLPQITGVGNTAQKQFDSTGVKLPN